MIASQNQNETDQWYMVLNQIVSAKWSARMSRALSPKPPQVMSETRMVSVKPVRKSEFAVKLPAIKTVHLSTTTGLKPLAFSALTPVTPRTPLDARKAQLSMLMSELKVEAESRPLPSLPLFTSVNNLDDLTLSADLLMSINFAEEMITDTLELLAREEYQEDRVFEVFRAALQAYRLSKVFMSRRACEDERVEEMWRASRRSIKNSLNMIKQSIVRDEANNLVCANIDQCAMDMHSLLLSLEEVRAMTRWVEQAYSQ
jgi:hypothetical protein